MIMNIFSSMFFTPLICFTHARMHTHTQLADGSMVDHVVDLDLQILELEQLILEGLQLEQVILEGLQGVLSMEKTEDSDRNHFELHIDLDYSPILLLTSYLWYIHHTTLYLLIFFFCVVIHVR